MNEHDPFSDQDYLAMRGRLRALGSAPLHSGVADRVLERVRSGVRPKLRGGRLKLLSAVAIAGFAASGVGLAAADVLPAPVQDAAHRALDTVGVNVPPGHNRYNDATVCPGGPYANHGAYVRAHSSDPNAGKSKCGKPVKSVNPSTGTGGADDRGQGAGQGKPSRAHGNGKPKKDDAESAAPSPTTAPKKPSATPAPTSSTTSAPTTTAPTTTAPTTSTTSTTTQP
jgi:hypothetical protein